ncbi:transposase, mutator type, partial [mine drainage metagenome]
PVRRPRVRGVEGGEAHLVSYDTFTTLDLLTEHSVATMLAGLSTRRYPVGLEPVGSKVEATACSISRSAVSRRFVAATRSRLSAFRSRDLSEERFLVVFADGFDFAGQTMVGALGVTAEGAKVPLGVVQGSTENATVVRSLITGLRDRGLNGEGGILFVLDGGKALHRAVQDVYGTRAVIQRCRLHKERNVLDHLPEAERGLILAQMRRAWKNPDADQAAKDLRTLAGRLDEVNP